MGSKIGRIRKKPFLCKLGFHTPDKEHYYVKTRETTVTSRSKFCKRCGKRLYLVDKYGDRVEGRSDG